MATNQVGTNLFVAQSADIDVALTDKEGNAVLIRCLVAKLPSTVAGYAVGCIAMTTDAGVIYKNSSKTSASFSTTLSS